MKKEYVLDIGIGTGGNYIRTQRNRGIERIGLDIDEDKLKILKYSYPEVLPVRADAQSLPFRDNSFKGIEMILPANSLIRLLQNDTAINIVEHDNAPANDCVNIYSEFSRILKPQGEILVYMDFLLHPNMIIRSSKNYFIKKEIKNLSLSEFEELDTLFSKHVLDAHKYWSNEQIVYWQSRLIKLRLKSKKNS